MGLSPLANPGDSIEQSWCRMRTEEEQRAVEQSQVVRMLLGAGAREIRLDTSEQFTID
jgi:hypothetical protein